LFVWGQLKHEISFARRGSIKIFPVKPKNRVNVKLYVMSSLLDAVTDLADFFKSKDVRTEHLNKEGSRKTVLL